ncbi:MAG: hypothetical protein CVV41_15010 [Candidatus Riflebacteria bacterium HGW-Riflebacteria-1]|jgi:biopolymer transport protein ExbB/TolQ|nr:MAG: hypothetical protein CVV41_15010 [Candidatus Riflebacteria bacterium HGW-Riflebacteria-1]
MKKMMIMTLIFSVVILGVAFASASANEDVSKLLRSFEKLFNNLKNFERELKSEADVKSLAKEFEETYRLVIDTGDKVYGSSYRIMFSKEIKQMEKDAKSIRFKLLQGESKQEISSAIVRIRETVVYSINCLMNC